MFVFDVSDTESTEDSPALPREVTHPFEVRKGQVGRQLDLTVENAKRDCVEVVSTDEGSQSAGSIRRVSSSRRVAFPSRKPEPVRSVEHHPASAQEELYGIYRL